MQLSKYVVYSLRDPSSTHPFYIGFTDTQQKRGNRRPQDHILEAKRGWTNKHTNRLKYGTIKKILDSGYEPVIEYVFQSDDKNEALEKEKEYIKLYGRRDNNTGILTNLTDGGEGASGVIKTLSDATKKKLSECRKGKTLEQICGDKTATVERERRREFMLSNNHMSGKKHSQDSIDKMRENRKGKGPETISESHKEAIRKSNRKRELSEETKKKMGAKNIGNTYCLGKPKSEEHKAKISQARRDHNVYDWFHKDHGHIRDTRNGLCDRFPELNLSEIGKLVRNQAKSHKGWTKG